MVKQETTKNVISWAPKNAKLIQNSTWTLKSCFCYKLRVCPVLCFWPYRVSTVMLCWVLILMFLMPMVVRNANNVSLVWCHPTRSLLTKSCGGKDCSRWNQVFLQNSVKDAEKHICSQAKVFSSMQATVI